MAKVFNRFITLFVATTATWLAVVAYAGVVVIGNKNLPLDHLSRNEIKLLFLKQPVSLHLSTSVHVYDQPTDSAIYAEFYRVLFNWSPERISDYWNSNLFNGQSVPPTRLDGDRAVIATINKTPNAISYIDSRAMPGAKGSVKILFAYPALKNNSRPFKKSVIHYRKNTMKEYGWTTLSNDFTLQADANKPMVLSAIENYLQHRDQVATALKQAAPLVFSISHLAKEKHVPMEVSLLPLLITKDDAKLTTLNPLITLHNKYGDWRLAIAAYIVGEQPVAQVSATKQSNTDFWKLNLPLPALQAVAQLAALAQLIKYASYYDLQLPTRANKPAVEKTIST